MSLSFLFFSFLFFYLYLHATMLPFPFPFASLLMRGKNGLDMKASLSLKFIWIISFTQAEASVLSRTYLYFSFVSNSHHGFPVPKTGGYPLPSLFPFPPSYSHPHFSSTANPRTHFSKSYPGDRNQGPSHLREGGKRGGRTGGRYMYC